MKTAAIIMLTGTLAGAATAQFTRIDSPHNNELTHAELLSGALGQSFHNARGRDFASDSFYADRIKDNREQVWGGGSARATIIGQESSLSHTFGYVQNGNFNALLDTDEVGSATNLHIDGHFEWAIKTDHEDGGDLWRSRKSRNIDCRDHMVTYAIYENDDFFGYALFFEDWGGWHSDRDFNDAAVLLTLVPTPHAAGLALAGLGGFGFTAARRRRG